MYKNILRTVLLILSGAAAVFPALAEEGPSISLQEYYYEPDSERPTQGRGFGTDLAIAWPLQNRWVLETRLFGTWIDDKGNYRRDAYRFGGALDFRYDLGNPNALHPYLIGGIGIVRNNLIPEEDESGATANLGVGWMSGPLNDYGVRLRGDLRAVYDDFDDGVVDWRAGAGIMFPLRRPQERIVEVEKVVYKEVPVKAPVDSDGDGVTDNIDKCPNTPRGALVDAVGCEQYLKRDIKETLYVEFDLDKSEVRPSSYSKLEGLASMMRKYPSAKMILEGHTDSTGPEAYNQGLSERRMNSVRDYLVENGANGDNLTAVGYGESQPIATNDTPEGRELNRRVEFRILSQ